MQTEMKKSSQDFLVISCHKLLPIWNYPLTWEFCEGSKTSSRFICYSFSLNLKLTKMSKTSKHHLTKSVERLYLVSCHKVLQKEDFELHLTVKWATNSVLHVVGCQFVGFLHFSWHCCLLQIIFMVMVFIFVSHWNTV